MIRKVSNFFILMRYWVVLTKSQRIINDPKGAWSSAIAENLTLEEMEGVFDLERVARLLTQESKILKKDLKHLQESLDK